jgi:hypothetical protein
MSRNWKRWWVTWVHRRNCFGTRKNQLGALNVFVLALEKSVECHKKNPYKHGFGKLRTNSGWFSVTSKTSCLWFNAGPCAIRDFGKILSMPTSMYLQESHDRGCGGCTSLHWHTWSFGSHGRQNPSFVLTPTCSQFNLPFL